MEDALTMELDMTDTLEQSDVRSDYVTQAKGVSLAFGGQRILDDISFSIRPGQAVLLRGDNGSGKTTMLNVLTGFIRPDKGHLFFRFNGEQVDVTKASPERIARHGLGRLWQDVRLFPTMTVLENVLAATPGLMGQNPFMAMAAWPLSRRQERQARESALHFLSLVGMADRANSSGDKLSLGQMKRVALARLLQTGAIFLLLDEPLAGLDKESAETLISTLQTLRTKEGKSMLIVEHQHEKVSGLCDETWYLSGGKLSFSGVPL